MLQDRKIQAYCLQARLFIFQPGNFLQGEAVKGLRLMDSCEGHNDDSLILLQGWGGVVERGRWKAEGEEESYSVHKPQLFGRERRAEAE